MQNMTQALQEVSAECLGFAVRRSARAVTNHFNALLRPLELNVAQFGLLVSVGKDPDRSLAAIAESLFLDETTLTRNLSILERRALIACDGGRGRAGKRVRLTEEGEAMLERSISVWRQSNNHLMTGFSEAELAAGRRFLSGLEESAHRRMEPGA